MKHLLRILVVVAIIVPAALLVATYTSCRKDKCKGVSCQHEGICNGGTCICTPGYEGTNCSVPWRNKFLGNWSQAGSSSNMTEQFQLSVVADTSSVTGVQINNFDNTLTVPKPGNVTSIDCLLIPPSVIQNKLIEGYAYYSGGSITIHYEVLDIVTNVLDTVNTHW